MPDESVSQVADWIECHGEKTRSVPQSIITDLATRYRESGRHYHDWSHVDALLGYFSAVSEHSHDHAAILYAILFHDAVYDPQNKDNEVRSAELFMAQNLELTPESRLLSREMILATIRHELPEGLSTDALSDAAHFLDMDLAILGASTDHFERYEAQIRLEYAHIPEADFRTGRAAILRRFLERERLYFSEWGYAKFEDKARQNLARSISALSG